jgi:hypothetical protein
MVITMQSTKIEYSAANTIELRGAVKDNAPKRKLNKSSRLTINRLDANKLHGKMEQTINVFATYAEAFGFQKLDGRKRLESSMGVTFTSDNTQNIEVTLGSYTMHINAYDNKNTASATITIRNVHDRQYSACGVTAKLFAVPVVGSNGTVEYVETIDPVELGRELFDSFRGLYGLLGCENFFEFIVEHGACLPHADVKEQRQQLVHLSFTGYVTPALLKRYLREFYAAHKKLTNPHGINPELTELDSRILYTPRIVMRNRIWLAIEEIKRELDSHKTQQSDVSQ